MKKFLLFTFLGLANFIYAQDNILEARGMLGQSVSVKGIVTNDDEFGPIRYFQDNTAGIAAYGSAIDNVRKGDSVTITGTVKAYNQLLEIDPITSVVIHSSGNPLPDPIELTPDELNETFEAMLVTVNNVTFTDAGGVFSQKKYEFTAGSESGYIYVKSSQADIVGQPIPSGLVHLTGILSQYDYTNPTAGYQLLPRTIADIEQVSSIYFTSTLENTNFTKSELDFTWTTNLAGTTEMFYGSTPESVADAHVSVSGESTSHTLALSGLSAGQIVWTQAFSVLNNDTAFSGITPFATISNSSGEMKVYFNTPNDEAYSSGTDALFLNQAIDDTLIAYINRTKYTLDLAIYNMNNAGISSISNALKAAADRGVRVRVIGCGTTANFGVDELEGSAVNVLIGPGDSERTGIMHNKFVVFDAESADANDPLVWTGSTNLTEGQINLDANNVIIVQDQSLARTYQIEFEEMWGSTGDHADEDKALFGFHKKNNTPHEFEINGKKVECYFSPSDGVNAKIVDYINTTDKDLSIATMLLTRDEIADAIAEQADDGDAVNMLTDAAGNNDSGVNATLLAALGADHYVYYGSSGIMHNKYMVVDQGDEDSDPLVLTGSHNWSAAANNDNDENTLIIHDATIANLYYQNFAYILKESNGIILGVEDFDFNQIADDNQMLVFPNPVQNGTVNLSVFASGSEEATLQMLDMTGKLVFTQKLKLINGANHLNYHFSENYKGTYILRLISNQKVHIQKVLFE
ncbi:MAG: T9SS type A sorting domain-containing protein [Bacteroidales bacterium]|nr:T9SS type A sorting domain-containing protein [Bacteroidales bacterium]